MTYIVIQALTAFFTFVFLVTGINFYVQSKKKAKHKNLYFWVAIAFFAVAFLTSVYFVCDIMFINVVDGGLHWLKLMFFLLAIFLFALCLNASPAREFSGFYGGYTLLLLAILIALSAWFVGDMESYDIKRVEQSIYNQKVVAQEPKVITQKYELIALQDTVDIGASYEGRLNGDIYGGLFAIRGTITGSESGELKTTDVYKLYYLADSKTGKMLPKTLEVAGTPLYYIKDGETPYLVKITTQAYALDYNVDPPKECNFKKATITYELHIPKGSILEVVNIDMK